MNFEHVTLNQRVFFGAGRCADHVSAEVTRLSASRVMVISSRSALAAAETAVASIEPALWWNEVVMHVPVDLAERATEAAKRCDIDLLVSVGGGSTTGLAKAIAKETALPIVAVPTTYSGSEATNVWGLTEDRTKTTGIDNTVLPTTVIYDPDFTRSLPKELSVVSGLNALAHCVDSLWAPHADPINRTFALEGAREMRAGLLGIAENPDDPAARELALSGTYLSSVGFASAGSALHHKICHVLGGTFNMPHAQTHATVLPYVLAFNAPAVPDLSARLAEALGRPVREGEDPADTVTAAFDTLRQAIGAPSSLADLGFTSADIPDAVARIVTAAPASNPVPVTEANMTRLLDDALQGTR